MDIVAVVALVQNEHADVGDGAQVDELLHLVLDEPLVDETVEHPLSAGKHGELLSEGLPHIGNKRNYDGDDDDDDDMVATVGTWIWSVTVSRRVHGASLSTGRTSRDITRFQLGVVFHPKHKNQDTDLEDCEGAAESGY